MYASYGWRGIFVYNKIEWQCSSIVSFDPVFPHKRKQRRDKWCNRKVQFKAILNRAGLQLPLEWWLEDGEHDDVMWSCIKLPEIITNTAVSRFLLGFKLELAVLVGQSLAELKFRSFFLFWARNSSSYLSISEENVMRWWDEMWCETSYEIGVYKFYRLQDGKKRKKHSTRSSLLSVWPHPTL
jgi:hypothetical protein